MKIDFREGGRSSKKLKKMTPKNRRIWVKMTPKTQKPSRKALNLLGEWRVRSAAL